MILPRDKLPHLRQVRGIAVNIDLLDGVEKNDLLALYLALYHVTLTAGTAYASKDAWNLRAPVTANLQ